MNRELTKIHKKIIAWYMLCMTTVIASLKQGVIAEY